MTISAAYLGMTSSSCNISNSKGWVSKVFGVGNGRRRGEGEEGEERKGCYIPSLASLPM